MTRRAALLAALCLALCACVNAQRGPALPPATVVILGFAGQTQVPICAAFAVTGPGGVRLLTAAHCLRGAMPGQTLAYATREQWEATASAYSRARIVSVDKGADRAELVPERGLDTLEQSPRVPDAVTAIAPGWHVQPGQVREHVGQYFVSTLDVRPGWSGSPVLDAAGRAVGIVVACEAVEGVCLPHAGVFVGLP